MKSFLDAFRRESAAGEQPLAALESASHEVSDAGLRTGLQNAVRLAQSYSMGPRPIHVNQVPGTLRRCLAVGFASGDVSRFMALASRILAGPPPPAVPRGTRLQRRPPMRAVTPSHRRA